MIFKSPPPAPPPRAFGNHSLRPHTPTAASLTLGTLSTPQHETLDDLGWLYQAWGRGRTRPVLFKVSTGRELEYHGSVLYLN